MLEVSWKEPPPTTVTLMMKRMMTPLISSAGGRSQVMLAVREVTAGTLKFSGEAVGTVARNMQHSESKGGQGIKIWGYPLSGVQGD